MPWSQILNKLSGEEFATQFQTLNGTLYYNWKPLKTVHTHLRDNRFKLFNETIKTLLGQAGNYKELTLIQKCETGKFTITIPKQPRENIYNHNNDSFRELAIVGAKHENSQYEVVESRNTNHCWLEPCTILDDRPTYEWRDGEYNNTNLILQGNGDVNKPEGNTTPRCETKPWIFWPRNPSRLELYLSQTKVKTQFQRIHNVSFIGNIENPKQEVNRNGDNWKDYCDIFHLTRGNKHVFTPEEYFEILSASKYGLCLPGYGLKCHREIECMALGTVPIVTKPTPMHSFANPLEKNIHYLLADGPASIPRITSRNKDRWKEMSRNCIDWYNENATSHNWFKNTITNIMF